MRRQRWVGIAAAALVPVLGLGLWGRVSARGQSAQATGQASASAQGNVLVPRTEVVYETVQSLECVQVPVTQMQTRYRTEYRTERVPLTRMVPETVNETRTITTWACEQRMTRQPITRIVCEPVTMTRRCYRMIPVTKNVERTIYQTRCTPEVVNKQITRMIPQCVEDVVPVTRWHPVCEPQLTYVTQRIPTTAMVPVVACQHACGHGCGGGCGQCGGATDCVGYRPVTTCVEQQVPVMRPVVRQVPETIQVPRRRITYTPVKETVQVCQPRIERIPIPVVQCVTTFERQPYEVTVTEVVPRRITEWVEVPVTTMVPQHHTEVVPVVRCRPVVEHIERQVPVCIPYQEPVTVVTNQMRTVTHQVPVTRTVMVPAATATGQAASGQAGR